jgi:hypothetical protein
MNGRLLFFLVCLTFVKTFAQIPEKRSFGNYTIKSTEPTIAVKMHLDSVTRQWTISREKNRFARKPVNSISIVGTGYYGEHEYAGYKPSTYLRIIIENEPLSGSIRAYFPNMFWTIQDFKNDIPVVIRFRVDDKFIFQYEATIVKKTTMVEVDAGQDLKSMIEKLEMAQNFYIQMLDEAELVRSFEHTQWRFQTDNAQKVIKDFQSIIKIKWIPEDAENPESKS